MSRALSNAGRSRVWGGLKTGRRVRFSASCPAAPFYWELKVVEMRISMSGSKKSFAINNTNRVAARCRSVAGMAFRLLKVTVLRDIFLRRGDLPHESCNMLRDASKI